MCNFYTHLTIPVESPKLVSMSTPTNDKDPIAVRRLTDLYRIPGFQTLARVTPHPKRTNALIVHLRRLKKNRDLFLLRQTQPAAARCQIGTRTGQRQSRNRSLA